VLPITPFGGRTALLSGFFSDRQGERTAEGHCIHHASECPMIKTERQYATTRAQLEKLTSALEKVASGHTSLPQGVDPRFAEVERRALESQLSDLRADIQE